MGEVRVGCSGWNYADWRDRVYPKGMPERRWLEDMHVGASFWWKKASNNGLSAGVTPSLTGPTQNDLAAMTTQGGFGFFSANYANGTDAQGNPIRSHLAPNGTTWRSSTRH